ncbi:hypothetical protein ATM97_27855 [Nocardia sp. MH4]|uniref:hypothetical protein n=1 Tax=Nocardia sp. MH4 TaxID=1768677 RepID=UPI001C4EA625|nr:hypothetical protein [Nocardia sp. MH4]MBW0275020.1 hypothetical protein [Nocardia sp. MH4]
MTDTCSCPPDDCHGGHTIQIGRLTDEHLRRVTEGRDWLSQSERSSMAAELLALRARVTTMEAQAADLADAESERARLSLYARNARRVIDTLWKSRRGHQSRASMHARMYRRARHSEAETRRDHDALAARVAELEAAQREPIGYLPLVIRGNGRLWLAGTEPTSRAAAEARLMRWRGGELDCRVVELREVTE